MGKEVQDILNQARELDLKNKDEVLKHSKRINNYLYSDNLRTSLNRDALPGLEAMQNVFAKKANRFIQLPNKKQERIKVIEDFSKLVEELKGYIQELQNDFFWEYQESSKSDLRTGGSGMLMYDLKTYWT